MDKTKFFEYLRSGNCSLFGKSLSEKQVQGILALLEAGEELPKMHMAYVLATVYHEVGRKMQPVRENLNYTSADRILQTFGSKRLQGIPPSRLVRKPERLGNTVYGGEWGLKNLGNTLEGDGFFYRGTGYGQATGRANHARAAAVVGKDVVANPEYLLDPYLAAKELIAGMTIGWYRNLKLSDFSDYVSMRQIINADMHKVGKKIAGYAEQFEAALTYAEYAPKKKVVPAEVPQEKPSPFIEMLVSLFKGVFK